MFNELIEQQTTEFALASIEIAGSRRFDFNIGPANTVVAMCYDASCLDASSAKTETETGNCPSVVLVAVLNKMEVEHHSDLYVADDQILPIQTHPVQVDRET